MDETVALSVVIITKNEASRIRDCIETVRWADEVLVVDDESTDRTVAIANESGARVLRRKMDIEGKHRNWAYAQAKHEWVLSLDADERVTVELADEICALMKDGAPFNIYSIPRRNFIGRHWIKNGGWYPSAQVKMFKRSVFRWEETTVHPRAISNEAWETLKHDLIHYSYRDLADFVDKLNNQTTREAQKWVDSGRRVPLGKALWRAIDRFFRSFVGKKGYRDHFWGFVVAVMAGMYQILAWAKYRRLRQGIRVEDIVEPFQLAVAKREKHDRTLLMSHLCAYRKLGEVASGARVLDIGFGGGYGAHFIGHVAREVIGIDVSQDRVATAQRLFRSTNVRYINMDGCRLGFEDNSFDVVGAFQVIEHIPESELAHFLKGIHRVLKSDGTFVVSTMNLAHNRKDAANYVKGPNHTKEYVADEFQELLKQYFGAVKVYGLYTNSRYRFYKRLKKWGFDKWGSLEGSPVRSFFDQFNTDAYELRPICTSEAIDLIGVCHPMADSGPVDQNLGVSNG